jgi:hypothetical protein
VKFIALEKAKGISTKCFLLPFYVNFESLIRIWDGRKSGSGNRDKHRGSATPNLTIVFYSRCSHISGRYFLHKSVNGATNLRIMLQLQGIDFILCFKPGLTKFFFVVVNVIDKTME